MKILASIAILSFFLVPMNCWVGIIGYNPKDFNENDITGSHCFSTAYGLNGLNVEEIKPLSNGCGVAKCNKDRSIGLSGCGVVAVDFPCYIAPGNLSKPYPDCCFELVCPSEDVTGNKL